MNLKRTLSAAMLSFALIMMPAFVHVRRMTTKQKSIHQIILRTQSRNLIRSRNRSHLSRQSRREQNGSSFQPSIP